MKNSFYMKGEPLANPSDSVITFPLNFHSEKFKEYYTNLLECIVTQKEWKFTSNVTENTIRNRKSERFKPRVDSDSTGRKFLLNNIAYTDSNSLWQIYVWIIITIIYEYNLYMIAMNQEFDQIYFL